MIARHEVRILRSGHAGRRALLATIVIVLLVHTGCRNKSAPEAVVPPGFTPVRDADAGFSIGIPSEWVRIPLPQDIDAFDKSARDLQTQNPNLAPAILQARQLLQQGGEVMAVSQDGNSSVNLTAYKSEEKTLDEIATATVKSLEEAGATGVAQERTTLPAGATLKLSFKYPIMGRDNSTVIADEVQYVLLRGNRSFVLTVINPPGDLAQQIATSLRLR